MFIFEPPYYRSMRESFTGWVKFRCILDASRFALKRGTDFPPRGFLPATFCSNPQFLLCLEDVDDDPLDDVDGCTFLVGLMQKDGRRNRQMGEELSAVGFAIYAVCILHQCFLIRALAPNEDRQSTVLLHRTLFC